MAEGREGAPGRSAPADTYASRDDAIAFTISKAKQIVDEQGDAIFK